MQLSSKVVFKAFHFLAITIWLDPSHHHPGALPGLALCAWPATTHGWEHVLHCNSRAAFLHLLQMSLSFITAVYHITCLNSIETSHYCHFITGLKLSLSHFIQMLIIHQEEHLVELFYNISILWTLSAG